ncbi:MAG: hypothetical protein HOV81_44945 [Kofleriaceae bacterium]|nr:hypothetical protein [Kofleriaceae bacterium]
MNLHDAVGAVRTESLERTGKSGATRARVLENIHRTPSRRLHAAVAAVIASLFGASAFAFYARTPAAPPPQAAAIALETTAAETAETSEASPPREVTTMRIEAPPPVEVETSLGTAAEVAPPPAPPRPARAVERDAELALYGEAHRAHFIDRDMTRALAAWDRYLAAMPDGRLAPEARFNRLVALVKLERWDEAARAIETVDASSRPADVERLRALISSHSN